MSSRDRYCSSRLRRPTSSSSPRRLWWSCLCTWRFSVRSWIRRVSNATWTSGEPVSPSLVACPAMISFFTVVSSGTLLPIVLNILGGRPLDAESWRAGRHAADRLAFPPGEPPEGAADRAGYSGRPTQYHADGQHHARKPVQAQTADPRETLPDCHLCPNRTAASRVDSSSKRFGRSRHAALPRAACWYPCQ